MAAWWRPSRPGLMRAGAWCQGPLRRLAHARLATVPAGGAQDLRNRRSERIHESVWQRIAKEDGPPLPSPYRDQAFLTWIDRNKDRTEPLSPYEIGILRDLPTVAPETTLPRPHRVTAMFDRIVEWLGGT
jgi:hypothetical protein